MMSINMRVANDTYAYWKYQLAICTFIIATLCIGGCRRSVQPSVQPSSAQPVESIQSKAELPEGATANAESVRQREGFTEADLGIPIYPNAKLVPGLAIEMDIPSKLRGYKFHYLCAVYETQDAYPQVAGWYKAALTPRGATVDEFMTSTGKNVLFRIVTDTDRWVVSVQQSADAVRIIIKRLIR